MVAVRLPIPWTRTRGTVRFAFCISGVLLMTLGYRSYSGQAFDGLMLFGTGGILLLTGVVYFSEWFENMDYGLRIVQSILVSAVAGGIVGCAMFGLAGIVGGAVCACFAAELVGAFGALYLHGRDRREAREYDTEMMKKGEESKPVLTFRRVSSSANHLCLCLVR